MTDEGAPPKQDVPSGLHKQLVELPKEITLIECPEDGLILQNKRWIPLEPVNFVKRLAKTHGEVDMWEVIPAENGIDVEVSGWLGPGEPRRERHRIIVKVDKRLCDVHNSVLSGYWEATLQLRGGWDGEHFHFIEHRLEELAKKDRWAFHREKAVKGGLDIFVGSKQAVWKIAQEMKSKFGAELVKSTTVVGRKNNKNLNRLTVSVRFPGNFSEKGADSL
ncbi:MAG: NMD3-related protein [Candidatus Aenigmatarchaeota archaeon]